MKIEQVGAKQAVDIFCGGNASFYKNKKNQLFGWGLNNHGQLGIGHKENVSAPTRVWWRDGEEKTVTQLTGGEHHTIALTEEGQVYVWGRNDEGEAGVGDLFGDYRKQ
jgi:regulator of chromosome condensation